MTAQELTIQESLQKIVSLNPFKAFIGVNKKRKYCIYSRGSPESLILPAGWVYAQNKITSMQNEELLIIEVISKKTK